MNRIKPIAGLCVCLLFSIGCVSQTSRSLIDLDAKLSSESYVRKFDNFMVILDTSGSMKEKMGGRTKTEYSKMLLKRINGMMPDLKMTGALRTFGYSVSISEKGESDLVYWPVKYQKDKFEEAIEKIKWASGTTGLDVALDRSIQDIEPLEGNTAIIIFSDGKLDKETTIRSAEKLKLSFGDRICFYAVHVESETNDIRRNKIDRNLLNAVAEIGRCGFCTSSKQLETNIQIAEFIEKVFMDSDSDRDGIGDAYDTYPDTPDNIMADDSGRLKQPIEAQAPGYQEPEEQVTAPPVQDKEKVEPGEEEEKFVETEPDAPVEPYHAEPEPDDSIEESEIEAYEPESMEGYAYELESVIFDTILFSNGDSSVHPRIRPRLNAMAAELKRNPEIKLLITGHTDPTETDNPEKLSRLRAEAIGQYLIDRGVHAQRLDIKGLGDDSPRNSNMSPVGRADNRRVEFYIMK